MELKMVIAAIALIAAATAANAEAMSKEDIARLPPDKVEAIKGQCAKDWGNDFGMRVWCEDKQYKALQVLINRGGMR